MNTCDNDFKFIYQFIAGIKFDMILITVLLLARLQSPDGICVLLGFLCIHYL